VYKASKKYKYLTTQERLLMSSPAEELRVLKVGECHSVSAWKMKQIVIYMTRI
jgi:hypothetical protein